jgi:ATP-dependent Zn protease
MVWRLGMGQSGLIGDYSAVPVEQLSEETKARLDNDTNAIIRDCVAQVEELLKKENDLFERFAAELLQKNELEYDEIEAIFAE